MEDFETTQRALLGPKQKSETHQTFCFKAFFQKSKSAFQTQQKIMLMEFNFEPAFLKSFELRHEDAYPEFLADFQLSFGIVIWIRNSDVSCIAGNQNDLQAAS